MLVETGKVKLLLSTAVRAEYEEVLLRPELKARRRGKLTDQMARDLLDWIDDWGEGLADVPRTFELARDPDDEPYLNLAVASRADYLISRDRDLLSLADPGNPDGLRLRALAPQLEVTDPTDFLRKEAEGTVL